MLDQNTDRMWYVIGAVIVGAALVFLMNGIFPNLFGTIGYTFQDKVADSVEMTDGIKPPSKTVYGPNMVVGGVSERFVHNSADAWQLPSGKPTETYIHYDLTHALKPNVTYEFSFEYKTTSNIHSAQSFFLGNTPESTVQLLDPTNGQYVEHVYSFTTKDPVGDPTYAWYDGTRIRFDNNFSKDGQQATLWVKNVSVREVLSSS